MLQAFFNAVGQFMKIIGILNIYTGLLLIAGSYYVWGLLFLLLGFAFCGLKEEGTGK